MEIFEGLFPGGAADVEGGVGGEVEAAAKTAGGVVGDDGAAIKGVEQVGEQGLGMLDEAEIRLELRCQGVDRRLGEGGTDVFNGGYAH